MDPTKLKQNLRAFWKLMNLRDCVWAIRCRIIIKTILHEKETIHYSITIWCTNLFPCVKPWKFPQQRQQWTRNGKNWRKFRRGTWRKSEVRKKWSMKQGRRALQFILHHQWTYVIWKCWIGGKAAKRQRSRCTPRWYCKRRFWFLCSIHWTRIISISNDSSKSHGIISRLPGCDGQAADAVSAYNQVKMEDAHKLLKIPKSECPDIWIRPPRHKWPKLWSSMEDPVVPLERNLYGHPLAGLLWERQIEKILLERGWEKIPNLGMSLCTSWKKDYSYLCMWMTWNWLERNKILIRCGK